MKEVEIAEIPPLQAAEQSLLDMHSVLNVFNVLCTELALIGLDLAGDMAYLSESNALVNRLVSCLRDPTASLACARQMGDHIRTIRAEIDRKMSARPEARKQPDLVRSLLTLDSIFAILNVRAREILARAGKAEHAVEMRVEDLEQDFRAVFTAMESGGRGRFRIVYNAALQEANDYYMDMKFEGDGSRCVRLPLVFKDVMRDLIANARKYTAPGGRITSALHADQNRLRFVVIDTGRGIPPDEITSVVNYGRRGSNVSEVRTMGGGFGLTKAFFVTKQFGGRFWIASELNRGTSVRIEIPFAASGRD